MIFNSCRPKSPVKLKKKRRPTNRTIMDCPVPGCMTRNVSKLADHIRVLHPQFNEKQRGDLLKLARKNARRVSHAKIMFSALLLTLLY